MIEQRRIISILFFLSMLCMGAWFLSSLAPHDPLAIQLGQRLHGPNAAHLFGTDELGRDLLSRTLRGFSLTVTIAFLAFITAFVLGTITGAIAGLNHGRFIDKVFEWVVSLIFSIPFLLLIAAALSIIDKNLINAYIVLSAVMWVSPARIVRANIIKALSEPYVMAEKAMGKSTRTILFRTLIPVSVKPAFIFTFGYFPEIVGLEAGLSFLGLGVQPPTPGLGKMIFDSLSYMNVAWWYAVFPAGALFIVVAASNILYRRLAESPSQSSEGSWCYDTEQSG